MKSKLTIIAFASLVIFSVFVGLTLNATADQYPAARVIVLSEDSDVTVTFQSSDAGANNQFGLWSPEYKVLGYGHSTAPGTVFNLGRFPKGTELIFYIVHGDSGCRWLTGPGERNGDGQVHAAISDLEYQTWLVGFEDLPGGGDRDFNDIRFIIKGDLYIAPPYNQPPTANANGPYVGNEGSAITFDASGSTDPDGKPLQYRWDLNNDGTWDTSWSSSPTASHTWGDDWSGTAKVEVSDGELTDTATASVTVNNVAPIVDALPAVTIDEGGAVTFDGRATDPGSDDLTFTYNWGDGTSDTVTIYYNNGVSPDPYPSPEINPMDVADAVSHTYGDNGVFTVTLTVEDDDGGVTVTTTTVTVNNVAPIVDALPTLTIGEGDTVSFTGHATDPGSDDLTFAWTWESRGVCDKTTTYLNAPPNPDPYPSPNVNPTDVTDPASCQYGDNGVYTVTLTVTDDDGDSTTITTTVTVNNVAPMASIDPVDQPNPIFILPVVHTLTFTGSFTDPGWLDTHTATWDFGDGTVVAGTLTEENEQPDATGTTTATHAYSMPGTYAVTLTVTDDDDGVGIATTTVTVMTAEEAKHVINDYVQDLPDDVFDGPAVQRKNAFANKFVAADEMIDTGNYRGVINKLQQDIRAKADGYVDGNPKNDWIIDSGAQQAICTMIDDLIAYLETLL